MIRTSRAIDRCAASSAHTKPQGSSTDMGTRCAIQVSNLTKRYGPTVAVADLSFEVRPGCVTGFLGPNGAGKSTTMRAILGLDAPTSGEALIGGRRYIDLKRPMHYVGALLNANAVHPGRGAFDHLLSLALTNGIGSARVHAVLEQVGLAGVAKKKVGGRF